ncbi:MAG: DUF4292 domain-containing protein [Flavipsychrobacter sp.]
MYIVMNRSSRILLLLLAGMVLFASCRTGKKVKGGNEPIEDSTTVAAVDTVAAPAVPPPSFPKPIIGKDKQAMIANAMPYWERILQYSTFSGKAKMHYEDDGQKQDFIANFRMVKDSAIWVSVSALGGIVTVARALVRPDSIFVLNYLQKDAYVMSAAQAGELLPVQMDFSVLQNLIIGEALSRDGMVVDVADFGSAINLHVMDARTIQQINYSKADSALRTLQMIANTGNGSVAAYIQYGSYEEVKQRYFANKRAININNNGKLIYMDMSFSNVDFDEELSLPFRIPKSYTLNPPMR